MKKLVRNIVIVFLSLLLTFAFWTSSAQAEDRSVKRILILNSHVARGPWKLLFSKYLRERMEQKASQPHELNFESLDLARYSGSQYKKQIVNLLNYKYQTPSMDLVIAVLPDAIKLILDYDLFPKVPKIFIDTGMNIPDELLQKKNAVVINIEYNFNQNVEHALALFPDTERIYVINGTGLMDIGLQKLFRVLTRDLVDKVSFEYLSGLSIKDLSLQISRLPEKSIIYYLSYVKSVPGQPIDGMNVEKLIGKTANRPVFTFVDLFALQEGILGGRVLSTRILAKRTNELAWSILKEGKIGTHKSSGSLDQYIYEWKELKKWDLNETDLPSNAIILDKEYSFIELYRWELVIAGILILILMCIIALFIHNTIQRKQVEKNLRDSGEQFRNLMEQSPISILIMTPDGQVNRANASYMKLWGFNRHTMQEVYEKYNLLEDEQLSKFGVMPLIKRAFAGESVDLPQIEYNAQETLDAVDINEKEGEKRWVQSHLYPVKDKNGSVMQVVLMLEDITQQKRAEKELRLTKYSIDNSSSAALWIKPNGHFRYVNEAVSSLTGYSHQELLGLCLWDLDHNFSPDTFPSHWQELEEKGIDTFESVCTHKKGRQIPIEITTNLHDFEGEKFIFAYVVDITERRKSEMERTQLVSAVEQSNDNIVITDIDGNIEYVNPAFERNTGYSRSEVHGENQRFLKSGEYNDAFYRNMWETITSGRIWTGNIINKRKNESLIEEFATIFPVVSSSGEIKNFVAVKRDMTEQNIMEDQLRQMQKLDALGTLASGVAHDFNNILGAIFGYTQLSKKKLSDFAEHQKVVGYLDKIFSASGRAKELIDQILTFSRKGDYDPKDTDLKPLVEESIEFLRATIPTTISIKHKIDPDLRNTYGDATQIQQVIMNLCTNASQAMEEKGGVLTVELTNFQIKQKAIETGNLNPGDYLLLTVSDTGKGMNDETKQRIFEPFFTTKDKGKGTGLGLSAAHGIVTKHGGAINVYSQEGLGTKFNIYLPAWMGETIRTKKEVEPELPIGSESILFVDDEPDLCGAYGEMLKSQGYQTRTTLSSRDALDKFIQNPDGYDLVITDYTMPEMNGIELSREICKYNNTVPVILISGLGELISDKELKSAGIVARYSKPIEFGALIRGVRDILDNK